MFAESQIKIVGERLLFDALGGRVRLSAETPLGGGDRSTVSRFQILDGPAGAPASVVIKRALATGTESYDPAIAGTGPAWRLFNDWAALQFLNEVAGDAALAPRVLAGDWGTGVLVLEDLRSGIGLHEILLGADPAAAEDALVAYSVTLGRMHARTIGKRGAYRQIRDALGPPAHVAVSTATESSIQAEQLADAFRLTVDTLGVMPATGLDGELAAVATAWAHPGPFLALVHSDPCPDNCLSVHSTVQLLDFEFARFDHALIDGVYGRMHFPSCW